MYLSIWLVADPKSKRSLRTKDSVVTLYMSSSRGLSSKADMYGFPFPFLLTKHTDKKSFFEIVIISIQMTSSASFWSIECQKLAPT